MKDSQLAPASARIPPWTLYTSRQRWLSLAILFLVSTSNYFDRYVISVVLEPIKHEFQVSDTMLGLLSGFAFSVFYVIFGMPVARWADRGNRRTIITLALTVWSFMTMCCGLAQSFWQLALARVGVGVGESGAIPPAQSLIADYFAPARRTMAIAIFTSAATAGYLLAFGVGGYIAATYGWRSAFLLAGAPGLLLALITRMALAEPRLHVRAQHAPAVETLSAALANLRRKKSYFYAVVSCVLFFLFGYGVPLFIPSFLVRVLQLPLAQATATYGAAIAVASVIGTLGGGWLADRLAERDIRWLAWLPAITCLLALPMYVLAFASDRFWVFISLAFAANVVLVGGQPPVYAAIHAVCGSRRRAMAIAIAFFSGTLLGGGLGPLATGMLSDGLSAVFGVDGLRYALMIVTTVLIASGGVFYLLGRAMPRDLED